MNTRNPSCRPLLRGVLVELFRWRNDPRRPGWQRRMTQLAVWCPFCRRVHLHGWDPANDGRHAEHRVAHCVNGPFTETGYYISTLRKTDPGYEAHVTPPGQEHVRPTQRGTASRA